MLRRKDAVWLFFVGPGFAAYAALLALAGYARIEHFIIIGVAVALTYIPKTRPAFKAIFPFFLFAVCYDALRFVTPWAHRFVPIHVAEPYRLETSLFGIPAGVGGAVISLSEFFSKHASVVLDLPAAFGYTFYIYQPILLAALLTIRDRALAARFGWAFLVTNLLGFVTYYAYPAAPPWYVMAHGFAAPALDTPSNPARLAAVDALLGIKYFTSFYSRSSNVFAALPSMHAAYPLVTLLYGRQRHTGMAAHAGYVGFWLLVCFAAIYLGHHYLIDVLLGMTYALVGFVIVETAAKSMQRAEAVNVIDS